MKKMLFSAIAMVAFAGSTFASNEVVVEKQSEIQDYECTPCSITITKYNSDGSIKSSETKNYRVCNMTCEQAGQQVDTFFKTGKIVAPR